VRQGFTLIEVIAAVAVAALIVTAAYGVAATTITAQKRTEEVLGVRKEGAAILDLVSEDLFGAVRRDKEQAFVFGEELAPKSVNFVSVAWDPKSGRRTLGEIGYNFERSDAGLVLYRRFGAVDEGITDGGEEILVSDAIESWKTEVFDGKEWHDTWETTKSLPVAVRVEFALAAPGRDPITFTREVAVPSSNLLPPAALPKVEEVPR
jgi:type II secretion system protein J